MSEEGEIALSAQSAGGAVQSVVGSVSLSDSRIVITTTAPSGQLELGVWDVIQ